MNSQSISIESQVHIPVEIETVTTETMEHTARNQELAELREKHVKRIARMQTVIDVDRMTMSIKKLKRDAVIQRWDMLTLKRAHAYRSIKLNRINLLKESVNQLISEIELTRCTIKTRRVELARLNTKHSHSDIFKFQWPKNQPQKLELFILRHDRILKRKEHKLINKNKMISRLQEKSQIGNPSKRRKMSQSTLVE